MEELLRRASDAVWGWHMMVLFLGVGVLFTIRLRGIQVRQLGRALKLIRRREQGSGISSYAALCTALAATIGTGNIVGVATALCAGGPGALFWMLIAAFFGMATQYAEGFLAVKFRKKQADGWFGGPFCYIELGLGQKWKWLAKAFACIGAAVGILGVGTVTQINSITSAVDHYFTSGSAFFIGTHSFSYGTVISGGIVTVAAALVLVGGVKRISSVCETLVPFMSAAYLLFSAIVLIVMVERIPYAVRLIIQSAFAPRSFLGAGMGISLKTVLRMGVGRGVFTNEAGIGSSPIAAAAANTKDPVQQGLINMTGTFIDTIVICTVTGLCLIVTDAWRMPLEGVQITDYAWTVGIPLESKVTSFVLMLCLIFFAFATIVGWNFYAERCMQYLVGRNQRALLIYRFAYIIVLGVGPYLTVSAVWDMADILNAVMALPNLLALLLLQNVVVKETIVKLRSKNFKN